MQMLKSLMIVTVCALAMVLTGCGKKEGSKQSSPSAPDAKKSAPATQAASAPAAQTNAAAPEGAASMPDYAKMAEQNRQTLTQMNQGKTIEAVSAATLKDLLPADLPGMKRTSASGERNQMMGVDLSTAEGRYQAENGDASVEIKLMDAGNMSGPMRMGMAGWAMAQFNRETDTGYEKTTTYNGYKAYEKYDTQDKRGTMRVFVSERFIVEVQGDNVTIDTLKQALGKIDFKKLAAAGS